MFSSRFILFPTFKKNWCKKNKLKFFLGGVDLKKNTSFSFHFGFYAIFNITFFCVEILKKCPFTYWFQNVHGALKHIYMFMSFVDPCILIYGDRGIHLRLRATEQSSCSNRSTQAQRWTEKDGSPSPTLGTIL